MFSKIRRFNSEYPNPFKVLVLATFIDRLGSFLLFPFFALYITERFGVGMTQVGFLFTLFSAGNILGGAIGGALADKYGRRAMLLLGLISSGLGSIVMGLVNDLNILYIVALILGIFGDIGAPARQAMVADLLPKETQTAGYGLLRVAVNLSATIGPILGGFLAAKSYFFLFVADAVGSLTTAIIVFFIIPETKPQFMQDKPQESIFKTIIGYKEVLKDWVFVLFLTVSAITVLVYMQLNSTLSVFLRDVHGFPAENFGFLLSLNALMVVLFQFWITKRSSKFAPMKMMVLGTLFYMIGFGMYGFISTTLLFFIAMAILTVGEMIVIPVAQAVVALLAPEDMRGRYMAVFGFHWAFPTLFGVIVAGIVMDTLGPNWVWYLAGILCFIAMIGFWSLNRVAQTRFSKENKSKIVETITS
ncbi:MAG: MDR family MFS transporter [Candidatus Thorarchaeota archaeon]